MSVAIQKKRDYNEKEGTRKYILGIRCTVAEMSYIAKAAKKGNISKAAVVMEYFNLYRKSLQK